MTWVVGIYEAGYGPNLGPFVMTAVGCRVPAADAGRNLWDVLAPAVRRQDDSTDPSRLVVDDSKRVFAGSRGLADLERTALAHTPTAADGSPAVLGRLIAALCPGDTGLAGECWYDGTTPVPCEAVAEDVTDARTRFHDHCATAGVRWEFVRSEIICPPAFNRLVGEFGTKGAVLTHAMCELIRAVRRACPVDEPLVIFVDKHGGRNYYAAELQTGFDDHFVSAVTEGMLRSRYRVNEPGRTVEVTFQPRADQDHLCVAIGSIVSKYLREVLMGEFNRFWQRHVPGLTPTAGYPSDAGRFFRAIEPAVARLSLSRERVWRAK